ncbi:hypothetical protein FY192_04770, partial [Anaplasma marginale]|uniref:hypothetical protein n=1 Tax=Anaplasma marginale TaxID=770 RepID=UPI0012457292
MMNAEERGTQNETVAALNRALLVATPSTMEHKAIVDALAAMVEAGRQALEVIAEQARKELRAEL